MHLYSMFYKVEDVADAYKAIELELTLAIAYFSNGKRLSSYMTRKGCWIAQGFFNESHGIPYSLPRSLNIVHELKAMFSFIVLAGDLFSRRPPPLVFRGRCQPPPLKPSGATSGGYSSELSWSAILQFISVIEKCVVEKLNDILWSSLRINPIA
ncbi:hypothetical protein YC2023_010863 [Brassica napus]